MDSDMCVSGCIKLLYCTYCSYLYHNLDSSQMHIHVLSFHCLCCDLEKQQPSEGFYGVQYGMWLLKAIMSPPAGKE